MIDSILNKSTHSNADKTTERFINTRVTTIINASNTLLSSTLLY